MSNFRDYWRAKGNPEARVAQIDSMLKQLDADMQSKVDPTGWNRLLEQKSVLEKERASLTQ